MFFQSNLPNMMSILARVLHVKIIQLLGCFLVLTLCVPTLSLAQRTSRSVTGEIRDSKKAPLQGVSVLLKGTTRGVSTDEEGRFVMSDVPDNGTLVFSSTGFATMEVP
jgi:hypothetical protein